jgi:hypothetical protein
MIAKIAYGFAVAKLGYDAIEQRLVVPAILGEGRNIGRWVGCDLQATPYREDHLHRITIRVVDGNIHAHVKLFASAATQEYIVAVGSISHPTDDLPSAA